MRLVPSSSSSSDTSLSSRCILCRYNRSFHSLTSSIFSSLLRYSSTFVGRAGSYSSSQSVSACTASCFFLFFLLRPPRARFSPTPYFHSSSSVTAQSASVVLGGATGAAAGLEMMALGKMVFGLDCLAWGRRMGWKRSAGSIDFLEKGSEAAASGWLYRTGAEDMVAVEDGSLGSRRLSYRDSPPARGGGGGGGAAMPYKSGFESLKRT